MGADKLAGFYLFRTNLISRLANFFNVLETGT